MITNLPPELAVGVNSRPSAVVVVMLSAVLPVNSLYYYLTNDYNMDQYIEYETINVNGCRGEAASY